ncbi:uncharacterized protein G2W53_032214 [Senna tora]|uniref:Uncharacterized protein n=1 Tax=Senna tora TaxID=362788 RepID=A0A834SVF9_9FABA|nr:uncharacterized protein G2W53_032214 [Senna tora]
MCPRSIERASLPESVDSAWLLQVKCFLERDETEAAAEESLRVLEKEGLTDEAKDKSDGDLEVVKADDDDDDDDLGREKEEMVVLRAEGEMVRFYRESIIREKTIERDLVGYVMMYKYNVERETG